MTASSLTQSPEKAGKSVLPPRQALLLSLVLHALALAALADLPAARSSGAAPPKPLRVSVRVLPEAGEAQANARRPAMPPRRSKLPSKITHPALAAERAVPPAPTSSEGPSAAGSAEIRQAPGGIPQQTNVVAPTTVAVAVPQEAPAPDAAGLRQFRMALASEARRVRYYPEAARRAGLTGTVEIRVSVNTLSQRCAELAHSSGHAVLDEAALGMLRLAAERSPLPDSLRGKEFAVLLPVVFEVEE